MNRTMLNKMLLLRLLEVGQHMPSNHKITQLVYILQEEGRKERRTTFNYTFTKWHYEPYSRELERDVEQLIDESLISKKEIITLTEKGKDLTEKMTSFYEKEKVDSFLRFFSYLHLKETLYETSAYINQKYEIAKYATDNVITDVCAHRYSVEEDVNRLKMEIDKSYEELEMEEMETILKAKRIMADETGI